MAQPFYYAYCSRQDPWCVKKMRRRLLVFFSLLLMAINFSSVDTKCRPLYPRFTTNHTACKPMNGACKILKRGVSPEEAKFILKEHNKYKQMIASGSEAKRKFPAAANMMEFEWGPELAELSMAHAEQCDFNHDCNECREIDNYPVGQNLFQHRSGRPMISTPNWKKALKVFYDEIDEAPPAIITRFKNGDWGHFSQLIWANSWRLGCGYVLFKVENVDKVKVEELYTCNYGPGGNLEDVPMYIEGPGASKCPLNSSPSTTNKGLCKANDKTGPRKARYAREMFRCEFLDKDNCGLKFGPIGTTIRKKKLVDGWYLEFEVKGNEAIRVTLPEEMSHDEGFCYMITQRKGSVVSGVKAKNDMKLRLKLKEMHYETESDFGVDFSSWAISDVDVPWNYKTGLTLHFNATNGPTPQYLDIKNIIVYAGKCVSVKGKSQ